MLKTDEDSFICDLAEYYHIYDYKQFPATYIGTLAQGLPDKSRIKLIISNSKVDIDSILLASCVDALNILVWMKTKDAEHGWNRPKSITQTLFGNEKEDETMAFDSGDEFNKAFSAITGEENG